MWELRGAGDSVGARVTVIATGVPPGLGEPVFDRLDADIASAHDGHQRGQGGGDRRRRPRGRRSAAASIAMSSRRRASPATTPAACWAAYPPARRSWCTAPQADLEHPGAGAHDRPRRRARRGRDHRAPRSVRGPAGDADRRGDAGDRADGPLPAPSRAEHGRQVRDPGHLSRAAAGTKNEQGRWRRFQGRGGGGHGTGRGDHDRGARGAQLSVKELYALASERSLGKSVIPRQAQSVGKLADFDFSGRIGLFSPGGEVSRSTRRRRRRPGAWSSTTPPSSATWMTCRWSSRRSTPSDRPIPNRGIIANPNCSTIQMLVVLKPLHDVAIVEHINVATYQSVSGAGREAISELATQIGRPPQRPGPGQGRCHPGPDRLQLRAADRSLRGKRLHPRGDEDGPGRRARSSARRPSGSIPPPCGCRSSTDIPRRCT